MPCAKAGWSLPSTGAAGALILAERLRAAIEVLPHRSEDGTFHVTASFGVAVAEDRDPSLQAATVLKRADEALYAAKRAGRNRVKLWSATWSSSSPERSGRGIDI